MQIIGKKIITELEIEVTYDDFKKELDEIALGGEYDSILTTQEKDMVVSYNKFTKGDRDFVSNDAFKLEKDIYFLLDMVFKSLGRKFGFKVTSFGEYCELTHSRTIRVVVSGNHINSTNNAL